MRSTLGVLLTVGLLAVSACLVAADTAATATELTTEGIRQEEVALGDLVSDALLKASKADAALVSAAQFKAGSIEKGKVSAADIEALLLKPTRKWVVSELKGSSIRLALERGLARAPKLPSAHFLQVAGIKVQFDPERGTGTLITELRVKGRAVDDNAVYRVVMPEDLAKGASGYFTVPGFSEDSILDSPSGTIAEALDAFLAANSSLDYSGESRIVAQ